MGKYLYKTTIGRMKHDESRNQHIEKMNELNKLISETKIGSPSWLMLMKKLNNYENQLTIYDREMGY